MRWLALVLVVAACGGAKPSGPATPATPAPILMRGPTATGMTAELGAIGLDPKDLPPLGKLPPEQLRKVMPLFAKSLGTKCEGCHASSFDVRTPQMNVAEQMWDHFSRQLTTKEGAPLFCDSCHHGATKILDRASDDKVFVWMDENYVAKLARKPGVEAPGKDHACPTCHGEPGEMKFIHIWAEGKPFPKNSTDTPQVSR
ncbi:MAG TPA: hypothetical protein VGH28_04065 [Polyangiaceae bacterium]|jgi:hypothetical protein